MNRLEQLDSMRGLAAATVLIGHCLGVLSIFWTDTYGLGEYGPVNLLKYSPFSLLIAGHEAVVFFFTLSGFVLMLPILSAGFAPYRTFVIRRVFRIYLPYLGAVALALLLRLSLQEPSGNGYSDWIGRQWQTPITWELVLQHALLIGQFDTNGLDPVIWSLVHEMRISLVFPLLAWIVLRWNWKAVLAVCPLLSALGYGVHHLIFHDPVRFSGAFQALESLRYVPMFLAGALLAKHRNEIVDWWPKSRALPKTILLIGGWAAYTYAYWLFPQLQLIHKSLMNELVTLIGAAVFIAAAVASAAWRRVLTTKPILFLGKISYSLYLYHFIILMASLWTVPPGTPVVVVWSLTAAVSVAAAAASHRWVEVPAIRWGKLLSGSREQTLKSVDAIQNVTYNINRKVR